MKHKGLVLFALVILGSASWAAADSPYKVLNGPKDFYFGHISLTDVKNDALDPVVLRQGSATPEPAVLNLPLGPGDTIRTSKARRVEIQFDNATVVRLDVDSELRIETILAQSLTSASQMTNLVLTKGRLYVLYKQFGSREIFQILTPKAAVKPRHNSVALVGINASGATEVQMIYGKAEALYGADLKSPKKLLVETKEGATFGVDNRFSLGEPLPFEAFEAWNMTVNEEFDKLHKGLTPLPKPVRNLAPAVQEWAVRYASRFGEWLFDDYFGYVWRPFYNDVYPWGSWQPYFVGRWASYRNSMFWVPSEPWGWIPYHLGVWQWDSKRGWFWLPGSAFAPAWVDWTFFYGFWAWRPWSIWDWGYYSYYDPAMLASLYGYGFYGPPWGYGSSYPPAEKRVRTIPRTVPGMPLLSEYKSIVRHAMKGLQEGDPALRESVGGLGRPVHVADKAGLLAADAGKAAVSFDDFRAQAAGRPADDPVRSLLYAKDTAKAWADYAAAVNNGQVSLGASSATRAAGGSPAGIGALAAQPRSGARANASRTTARSLDFNPDVKMSRLLGVGILYDSANNMIACPARHLTSLNSPFSHSGSAVSGVGAGGHASTVSSGAGSSGGSATASSSSGQAAASGSPTHVR